MIFNFLFKKYALKRRAKSMKKLYGVDLCYCDVCKKDKPINDFKNWEKKIGNEYFNETRLFIMPYCIECELYLKSLIKESIRG